MSRPKRRQILIQPGLQMRLCLTFLCVSVLCITFQFVLLQMALASAAQTAQAADAATPAVSPELLGIGREHLLWSIIVLIPITFLIGIRTTFRLAGPIWKLERHMERLAAGEDPGELYFRKGDEFVALPKLVNDAVARVQQDAAAAGEAVHSPDAEPAATA
ncbi:MAG: hypothetical protein AAF581_12905 [Planctomycetota bacterium]